MDISEGYEEGLNALLSRRTNADELFEFYKAIGHSLLYLLPGVGLYREFKKPKEKRSKLGLIGSWAITVPFFIKIGLGITALVLSHNGNSEKKDNFYQDKNIDSLEINNELKKENELEKTIKYEEILK